MKPTVAQLAWLIGNPDVYAVQRDNGGYYPVYERLSPAILRQHLKGNLTVGTYLVRDTDQARTLVLDFDSGADAEDEAKAAYLALLDLGVPERGIGMEFSGNKGYHVWVVSSQTMSAESWRRIGKAALAVAGVKGEIYPKQSKVNNLGNLVKLPGGVHRVTGLENNIIGPFPQPVAPSIYKAIVDKLPAEAVRARSWAGTNPLECMANIQQGCGDGWRNHGMFHFATSLRRSGLEGNPLWAAMSECNNSFNPPLDNEELEQVYRSSENSGPICDTLPEEAQCSTCPYRQSSLYAKAGQLRYGKQGELAVVEVGKRRPDGTIEVKHPDLNNGLVRVRK
jgi:hypothetical protein